MNLRKDNFSFKLESDFLSKPSFVTADVNLPVLSANLSSLSNYTTYLEGIPLSC